MSEFALSEDPRAPSLCRFGNLRIVSNPEYNHFYQMPLFTHLPSSYSVHLEHRLAVGV